MKVEIDLPEEILNFLKDVARLSDLDLEEYLCECVVEGVMSDLDTIGDNAFWDPEKLKAKYGLGKFSSKGGEDE